ncbi:MAG: hypothetical protein WCT18_02425 [Patescibacteria group bacterium]
MDENAKILINEAKKRKIKIENIDQDFDLWMWQKSNRVSFSVGTLTELTDTIAYRLIETKYYVFSLLNKNGFLTNRWKKTIKMSEVRIFLEEVGVALLSRIRLRERDRKNNFIKKGNPLKNVLKDFFAFYEKPWEESDKLPIAVFLTQKVTKKIIRATVLNFQEVYFSENEKEMKFYAKKFIEAAKIFRSPVIEFECFIKNGEPVFVNASAGVSLSVYEKNIGTKIAKAMIDLMQKNKLI